MAAVASRGAGVPRSTRPSRTAGRTCNVDDAVTDPSMLAANEAFTAGGARRLWTGMVVLAAASYAAVVALYWAFPGGLNDDLSLVLRAALWLFAADLVLNVRRAFVVGGAAAVGYARTWLLPDVAAIVPLVVPTSQIGSWLGFLGLLKLTTVGRAMRGWRVRTLRYSSPLPLLFAVFWLGLVVHWIAAGWIVLRGADPELSTAGNYVDGFYWTVTTLTAVGYGDITPIGTAQKLYAAGTMVVGLGFLGYMIGVVASILSRRDPARVQFEENVERLTMAAQYGGLPEGLRRRVFNYYRYAWQKRLGYDESDFLESLPQGLKEEVARHMKGDVLERVEIFRDADPDFVGRLALRLRPEVLTPGDWVFREGDEGDSMYFVARGTLEVLQMGRSAPVAQLRAGDFFGEIALFENAPRTASVRSLTYADVYSLRKADLDVVIRHFPAALAEIQEKALRRRHMDTLSGLRPPA